MARKLVEQAGHQSSDPAGRHPFTFKVDYTAYAVYLLQNKDTTVLIFLLGQTPHASFMPY